MHRLIVSSGWLLSRLQIALKDFTDSEMRVQCKNKKLSFNNEPLIDVEAKSDFDENIETQKLVRLVILLRTIDDQPLTISFKDSNDWIQISEILI